MFDNPGALLPIWIIGAPLVAALIDLAMTPRPYR
jgi:hypothetical protein